MMRILLIATALFILIHFIRIDFAEGTIPHSISPEAEKQCEEGTKFITVTSIQGDTIESLFAMYPDHTFSFIDRLEEFYQLNPTLKYQEIIGGLDILLPISIIPEANCSDTAVKNT